MDGQQDGQPLGVQMSMYQMDWDRKRWIARERERRELERGIDTAIAKRSKEKMSIRKLWNRILAEDLPPHTIIRDILYIDVLGCNCSVQSNTVNPNVDSSACATVQPGQSCTVTCPMGYTGSGLSTYTCSTSNPDNVIDVSAFTCTLGVLCATNVACLFWVLHHLPSVFEIGTKLWIKTILAASIFYRYLFLEKFSRQIYIYVCLACSFLILHYIASCTQITGVNNNVSISSCILPLNPGASCTAECPLVGFASSGNSTLTCMYNNETWSLIYNDNMCDTIVTVKAHTCKSIMYSCMFINTNVVTPFTQKHFICVGPPAGGSAVDASGFSCTAISCPTNTIRGSDSCICNAVGYTGSYSWSLNNQTWTGSCTQIQCPINSTLSSDICVCNTMGYTGNYTWTAGNSSWTGGCTKV